jgi:signal transduction histidine kinase
MGVELIDTESMGCGARVSADRQRLKQVMVNLLSNAVKFTESGGRVRLRVRGHRSASGRDQVVFVVDDTGIGIPAERLRDIFEPFVQVETGLTRNYGGAGLGLAISRRLALLMGGDLEGESDPGRGSRFTLRLSAVDPVAADGEVARRLTPSVARPGSA